MFNTKYKFIITLALALCFAGASYAWPACSGNWIQVPAGTSTANGAIVTENGQTFQCQKPTDTSTGNTNANTNSNTNNNSNSNTNKNDQSQNQNQQQTANGGSAKSSSAATGGNATANGGVSTVKDSGNSSSNSSVGPISNKNSAAGGSVKDSGNSTSVSSATGGQGGSANATNNSSGNSTSVNETTNVAADKIPVNTAYSAAPYPTAQCFKGYGAGGQATMFGFSVNGGKIDENCAILETARSFDSVGERFAGCKVKIANKYAKKAHVTLEDCMNVPLPVPAFTPTPVAPPAQPIVIEVPAPIVNVLPTPVIINQTPTVPDPAFKAPPIAKPHKKIKPPVGIKPCPVAETTKLNGNCWEND